MEEHLKKAEEEFQEALIVGKRGDQSPLVRITIARYAEATYHLLSAIFHQNEAIIELLQKKS